MTAPRPHVTCPVCGHPRVPCKPTASGYVLLQHNKPSVGDWRRDRCIATGYAVSLDAVFAWVDAERQRLADVVERCKVEVHEAYGRLARAWADETEGDAALAKIAERARKAAESDEEVCDGR